MVVEKPGLDSCPLADIGLTPAPKAGGAVVRALVTSAEVPGITTACSWDFSKTLRSHKEETLPIRLGDNGNGTQGKLH